MRELNFKIVLFFMATALFVLGNTQVSFAYEKEINTLSASIAKKIAGSGKKLIAVLDFTDLQGNVTELGRFLAEEFSGTMVDLGKGFDVIDRIHLKSLLKEHKLSEKGIIDPSTARKLGKIAGVDAIVTGTITPFGETVRISAKVLSIETAKIISSSRGNIPKTKAIEELLAREIESVEISGSRGVFDKKRRGSKRRRKGATQQAEANKFTFELLECKMSGKNVICELLVTNNSEDRELEILNENYEPPSRLFDNLGMCMAPKKFKLEIK